MNSIPHHLLLSAEIRSLQSPEDKAAHIKKLCVNLPLSKICEELQANYQKSLRRYHALVNGIEFTGIGRPPLVVIKMLVIYTILSKSSFSKEILLIILIFQVLLIMDIEKKLLI